jgi:2-polyprenyl-3-methyl-5-hydroxy-6-metoxy-1,4-benzoquinol methylase
MSQSLELDRLDQLWPNRGIFQGAATAYMRWCEQPLSPCGYLEHELWQSLLRQLDHLPLAHILDVGSGAGIFLQLLIACGANPKNILALEPNPILAQHLRDKNLGVGCIRAESAELNFPLLRLAEIDIITANMLVNHLPTAAYLDFVTQASEIILPGGILAYTVPEPHRKAAKHGLSYMDNEAVAEEEAPWGGLVRYFHRPVRFQRQALAKSGFRVTSWYGGFDETYHLHDGPKRLMIIARKK